MGVTPLSAGLRIPLGVGLVGIALACGVLQRSPWILPFLAVGFTCAFLFGQLRTWRIARNKGKLGMYWLQLPADFIVQALLVGVLYLIGFGLSALVTGGVKIAPFGPADAIWPLAMGAVASLTGLYIDRLEGKPATYIPMWMNAKKDESSDAYADIRVLPEMVTVESFFTPAPPGEDGESYADLARGLSEDAITVIEARLGRALPDTLIALYQRQNGGSVAGLCVPKRGIAEPTRYEHVLTPFGGYNDLVPAEGLRTVWEAVTDFADPADPDDAGQFPDGCQAMVVLAEWYQETLFLDYNQPGAPRVGYADFDRFDADGEREPVTWWASFDEFFAALRHYERV